MAGEREQPLGLVDEEIANRKAQKEAVAKDAEIQARVPQLFTSLKEFVNLYLPKAPEFPVRKKIKAKPNSPAWQKQMGAILIEGDERSRIEREFNNKNYFLEAIVLRDSEEVNVTLRINTGDSQWGMVRVHAPLSYSISVGGLDRTYVIDRDGCGVVESTKRVSPYVSPSDVIIGGPGIPSYPEWSRKFTEADLNAVRGLMTDLIDPATKVTCKSKPKFRC